MSLSHYRLSNCVCILSNADKSKNCKYSSRTKMKILCKNKGVQVYNIISIKSYPFKQKETSKSLQEAISPAESIRKASIYKRRHYRMYSQHPWKFVTSVMNYRNFLVFTGLNLTTKARLKIITIWLLFSHTHFVKRCSKVWWT